MFYSRINNGFYSVDIHNEIPTDAIEITEELYSELMEKQSIGYLIVCNEGGIPEAKLQVPTLNDIKSSIIRLTQDRLDSFAASRNYDGILSACTYATSTVPKFQAEGQSAVNARDATWSTLYSILDDVQNGIRLIPTSFSDIEDDLPVLTWST